MPRGLLFLQWVLLATAASVFLIGYFRRWPHTPKAMAAVYAVMAGVCAVQTFAYLTNESRFRAMAIEYIECIVLVAILFSTRFFGRADGLATRRANH